MDFNMATATMTQPVQTAPQPIPQQPVQMQSEPVVTPVVNEVQTAQPKSSFEQTAQVSTSDSLEQTMQDYTSKVSLENNDTTKSQEIDIDEIKSLTDFDPTEILASKEQDSYFGGLAQEDKMDMMHAIAKTNFDFYNKERKNYSEEANQLMERIKRGHIPDDTESAMLYSEENTSNLDAIGKLNELKKRVSGGKIDTKDFNAILEMVGFDEEMSELLRQEFSSKGILIDEYENVNSEGSRTL